MPLILRIESRTSRRLVPCERAKGEKTTKRPQVDVTWPRPDVGQIDFGRAMAVPGRGLRRPHIHPSDSGKYIGLGPRFRSLVDARQRAPDHRGAARIVRPPFCRPQFAVSWTPEGDKELILPAKGTRNMYATTEGALKIEALDLANAGH